MEERFTVVGNIHFEFRACNSIFHVSSMQALLIHGNIIIKCYEIQGGDTLPPIYIYIYIHAHMYVSLTKDINKPNMTPA